MALRDVESVVRAARLPLRLLVSGCCIVAALTSSTATATSLDVARQKLEQAERELQAAVTAEEAAYRERDAFLSQHFQRLRENATPVPNTAQSAPLPTVNPRWQELDAKVSQLAARRQELLERLTPAHPLVLSLDDEIAQAQSARDGEAQLLAPEPDTVRQNQTTSPTVVPDAADAIARFQTLEEKCQTAAKEVDRLDAIQTAAAEALEQEELAERRLAALSSVENKQSAQIWIWGGAVVAGAAGVLCFSQLLVRRRSPRTAAAVARALELPLLAVVRVGKAKATS